VTRYDERDYEDDRATDAHYVSMLNV